MAQPLPAALKIPEVSRFINRANQLRTIKPAIAYWCEYHAVNQIVGKNLHTTDEDTFDYTKTLLERLEETKNERADDDAIVDNTAGQAYVEQFAQQTFERAERTLRANKVTRQTADTFDAAATFFDLTREWGTPEPDVLAKIKFARWNAARILKAIREGKDPNESNPPNPAEQEEEVAPALEPKAPDVQELTGLAPRGATVEDAPDAGEPSGLPNFIDQPPQPPSSSEGYFPPPPAQKSPDPFVPSPLSQSPAPSGPIAPPPVQPVSQSSTPAPSAGLPPPPPPQEMGFSMPQIPPQQSPQIPHHSPSQFSTPVPGPSSFDPSAPPSWSTTPSVPHPAMSNPPPAIPQPSAPSFPTPNLIPAPSPAPVPMAAPAPVSNFKPDQKSMNQAQKHAKWAISALNFDDVPTAIKELRNALANLGAQ